jgi:hypothetical protein
MTTKRTTLGGLLLPARLEIRYDRIFLLDLRNLETSLCQRLQQFVFNDFFQIGKLQDLSEFQALNGSEILYRFTIDNCLICIEVTGQIIKFLRVLPKPNI